MVGPKGFSLLFTPFSFVLSVRPFVWLPFHIRSINKFKLRIFFVPSFILVSREKMYGAQVKLYSYCIHNSSVLIFFVSDFSCNTMGKSLQVVRGFLIFYLIVCACLPTLQSFMSMKTLPCT